MIIRPCLIPFLKPFLIRQTNRVSEAKATINPVIEITMYGYL